nr:hypothetical protein [Ruminococcus bromii]
MTAEEWKKVDEALASVWSPCVHLKIDGYKVSLNLTQKSRFQNVIFVYVNDEFRGKWLAEDCEIRRRFYCCKKRSVVTERDFKEYKVRSKKAKQELKDKFSYDVYTPYWTNFESMKKHFIANNKSIELY